MRTLPIAAVLLLCGSAAWTLQQAPREPPLGPFGLSRVSTPDGKPVAAEGFTTSEDCAVCHERQVEEFDGSLHSVSHHDVLYRAFAELARREAGEQVYAWCSGCHAPGSLVSGLVPGTPEPELPDNLKAGVQCDICHQVRALTGTQGPWGEPGNASLVLRPGPDKAAIRAEIQVNPSHTVEHAPILQGSELCASCHTVIHPVNGLRLEHTYDEWKRSVYAEKGIQCQDCHMRSVEDATRVARTLEPVRVVGRTSGMSSAEREIHPHWFVGGNVDAARLGGGEQHAAMAAERLKSAAEIAIEPVESAPGKLAFDVAVTNVGAGHALPTSLTELREMWVHVRVSDSRGELLFESGALDLRGELPERTLRFGSVLLDAQGHETFKPWEAVSFASQRLVPPKGTDRERFQLELPAGAAAPFTIEARLKYRIASPRVVRAVLGEDAFEPTIVEMAAARR